jgi:hypothetical protein
MQARPAKRKLVKLAKVCFLPAASRTAAQPIPGTSIRFVRVRSYDRPDRSIVTVLLDTSM